MVSGVVESLMAGRAPQPIEEGMGGSYLVRDRRAGGRALAVFKPADEEPCAPNNPKGLRGRVGETSVKPGVLSGEQAVREVLAYLLDHNRLANVPETLLVSIDSKHVQHSPEEAKRSNAATVGSLQRFVENAGPCGDFGPASFPREQVQAIAALDMRLMNVDRHDGNILVQTTTRSDGSLSHNLVPIDHGCILPDSLNVLSAEWCFAGWPQLEGPVCPKVLRTLLNLDLEADSARLRRLGIREKCVRTMRLATLFLRAHLAPEGNGAPSSLALIASRMARPDFDTPSHLERTLTKARWRAAAQCLSPTCALSPPDFHRAVEAEFKAAARALVHGEWA